MAGHPIDKHVGERLRQRRADCGLPQQTLAEHLGLSAQQLQKYETGINRISASRLFDLSRALDVPVGYFFADMPKTIAGQAATRLTTWLPPALPSTQREDDMAAAKRELRDLVRAYYTIENTAIRRQLLALMRLTAEVTVAEPRARMSGKSKSRVRARSR